MEILSEVKCFGGKQLRFKHQSQVNQCEMVASIYLPPHIFDQSAKKNPVPVLYWLSGLTCTDENFVTKAGAQRYAAEQGIAIVAPDTSPRGDEVPKDPDNAWDFGAGAGFYISATQQPWAKHYHMYEYVLDELPELISQNFPVDNARQSISGHSMGGHGALTIALKNPDRYCSVSAFAPIVSPLNCAWGEKALSHYVGPNKGNWKQYDTCELVKKATNKKFELLIDQGTADNFLVEQLKPALLEAVCKEQGYPLKLRMRAGYDHSYYFISSFIGDHIAFHAKHLS